MRWDDHEPEARSEDELELADGDGLDGVVVLLSCWVLVQTLLLVASVLDRSAVVARRRELAGGGRMGDFVGHGAG